MICYAGEVNRAGYESVCEVLAKKQSDRALLVLSTPGGDAHAGFRIARALQHTYDEFDALVPRYCKSAGTLILIGAKRLYLADRSELGPLDVQVKKGDELVGVNSGLDIFQAINYLQSQVYNGFSQYVVDLNTQLGLSTRLAADIATKLALGLLEPVADQIDPMKLAEMQRATEIAFAYGHRLNAKANNLRSNGLRQLVTGYPSHGFVIDRAEARTLFTDVQEPEGLLLQVSEALRARMQADTDAKLPKVEINTFPVLFAGDHHGNSQNAAGSAGGDQGGQPEVVGSGENGGAQPADSSPPAEPAEPASPERPTASNDESRGAASAQ